MIVCCIGPVNAEKVRYTLNVIFGEFLGVSCFVVEDNKTRDYIEIFKEGSSKRLFIKNIFLRQAIETFNERYLPKLPLKHARLDSAKGYIGGESLPVLFGGAEVAMAEDKIRVEIDLIGGAFFCLSRYEELVIDKRDEHGRFPADSSLAYNAGMLELPIVDKYVLFIKFCLVRLWGDFFPVRFNNPPLISCDVDQPIDTTVASPVMLLKTCVSDAVKRGSLTSAISRVRRYFYNKAGDYRYDPFYTFDWYMDLCESVGLKATFYFIPTSREPNNGSYELTDPPIQQLLKKISARGHEIGVHGSYQTYRDGNRMCEQKKMLETALYNLGLECEVLGNRQHFLRWDASVTPDLLEKAGFKYDSTGGYADRVGYRYGTAREFSMWGWQTGGKLSLKQRPLVVMECTIIEDTYMGFGNGEKCYDLVSNLIEATNLGGGVFSLLWHNSNLTTAKDKALFSKCVKKAVSVCNELKVQEECF